MSGKNEKSKGFILTEIIVALTVLGIVLAGLGVSLAGFAKFNRYQLVRQRCIAAAQAQLDSIAATGQPIGDEDFGRLWPKLTVSVKQSPGERQWQGLEFVEVTASGKSYRKDVNITLSRYIGSQTSEDGKQNTENQRQKTEARLSSSDLRVPTSGFWTKGSEDA